MANCKDCGKKITYGALRCKKCHAKIMREIRLKGGEFNCCVARVRVTKKQFRFLKGKGNYSVFVRDLINEAMRIEKIRSTQIINSDLKKTSLSVKNE